MKNKHIFQIVTLILINLIWASPIFADIKDKRAKTWGDFHGKKNKHSNNPIVLIQTNYGEIKIVLYPKAAPKTVENFLNYVRNGDYDGTIFHRVIKDFMIQGGGYDKNLKPRKTKLPIVNESDISSKAGLLNKIGYIAMARTNIINSATNQFFINTNNNDFLNFTNKSIKGWGYCVFGKVITGMKTVNLINEADTKYDIDSSHKNLPVEPIIIIKAKQLR